MFIMGPTYSSENVAFPNFPDIFSDINIALHTLRMGPAKGAKVSTIDSTLGDPAAEKPPMQLSLGYAET